jgi:hypothetical protein
MAPRRRWVALVVVVTTFFCSLQKKTVGTFLYFCNEQKTHTLFTGYVQCFYIYQRVIQKNVLKNHGCPQSGHFV